jgi:hypothetical protein
MRTNAHAVAALALSLGVVGGVGPAAAREIAGVSIPDSVVVDGKPLRLNGAGIRKKFIVKVYVGGLYTAEPAASFAQIKDQPWEVHMHFLRSVDKSKVIGAFKEGFEKNSKDKAASLQPGLDKLSATLRDLQTGDVLIVSYSPGKGSTVGIKGGPSVTVEGADFGQSLLRNWLGNEPADADLKKAMLGG